MSKLQHTQLKMLIYTYLCYSNGHSMYRFREWCIVLDIAGATIQLDKTLRPYDKYLEILALWQNSNLGLPRQNITHNFTYYMAPCQVLGPLNLSGHPCRSKTPGIQTEKAILKIWVHLPASLDSEIFSNCPIILEHTLNWQTMKPCQKLGDINRSNCYEKYRTTKCRVHFIVKWKIITWRYKKVITSYH